MYKLILNMSRENHCLSDKSYDISDDEAKNDPQYFIDTYAGLHDIVYLSCDGDMVWSATKPFGYKKHKITVY